MKLLDTNIIVYAAGRKHPHKEKCAKLLNEAVASPGAYNVSVEVLQEILHVYYNKREKDKGVELVEGLLHIFPQSFTISTVEIEIACMLLNKYERLNARDALHAAVVINYNLEAIVSFDKHFDSLSEIKRLEPI